jgi:hypothetical protein
VNAQPEALGDEFVNQAQRDRQATLRAEDGRQIAVGCDVIVFAVADEAHLVKEMLVQMGEQRLRLWSLHALADGLRVGLDRRVDVGRVGRARLVHRDGDRAVEQGIRRIDRLHMPAKQLERRGRAAKREGWVDRASRGHGRCLSLTSNPTINYRIKRPSQASF